jgi:hydrogenase nickel incorporation protein HypA/HybF
MHETIVAQSLLTAISQEAAEHSARPIRAKISCGQLNAINDEVLSFAFEAIAKGTLCRGLELQIEHKAMQARCRGCGRTFEVELSNLNCPGCSSDDFELLPDAPLMLEHIEFQEG